MSRIAIALWLLILSGSVSPQAAQAGRCPNLSIVVDRSGSMLNTVGGTMPAGMEQSRWQIAQRVITNVINQYADQLPIGISYFPRATTSCGTGGFVVKPGYGNKNSILGSLNDANTTPVPTAQTPTCGAIDAVAQDPLMQDGSRGQYILLVTDGGPRCINGTGCTCDACNLNGNAPYGATESVRLAFQQSPSIHTFVVGFSGTFMLTEQQNLNDMAKEGGELNPDPNFDYYPADNEQALAMQIDKLIRTVISGGDTGGVVVCDDSCYTNKCPSGQICVQNVCAQNPCATQTCGAGEYCYSDGTSASCTPVCKQSCKSGSRCVRGTCESDPCEARCAPGSKCDSATRTCQPDPACNNVRCRPTQGCFGGACLDDVCSYISCPGDTFCVPYDGTCANLMDNAVSGCSCDLSQSRRQNAALLVPIWLLVTLLYARRRRTRNPVRLS